MIARRLRALARSGQDVFHGGLAPAATGAVMMALPVLGAAYLDERTYAEWALLSTVTTVALVVDLGAPLLATKLAAERRATALTTSTLCGLSVLGSALVGAVAFAGWLVLGGRGVVPLSGAALGSLAAVVAATMLKSCAVVLIAVCFGHGAYRTRAALLWANALAQVAGTWLGLAGGLGTWSLGAGLAGAAILTTAAAARAARFDPPDAADRPDVRRLLAVFGRTRLATSSVGLLVTQLDRWFVALCGNSAFLATYDVAARLAVLPKVALLALSGGLVRRAATEARRADAEPDLGLRHAVRVSAAFVAAASVLVTGAGVGLYASGLLGAVTEPAGVALAVFVALLGANAVHATTAPVTYVFAGLGRPDLELSYLVPCALVAAAGDVLGVATRTPAVVAGGVCVALAGSSAWFLSRALALRDVAALARRGSPGLP